MTTLVVGCGGAGQSYFIKFLKKNAIRTNHLDDLDSLKHASFPDNETLKKKQQNAYSFITIRC